MNEEATRLIAELADKLGTTAEYLFGVLVKQAAISAVTDIIVCTALVVVLYFWIKFLVKKTSRRYFDDGSYAEPDWQDEAAMIAWIPTGCVTIITAILVICSISELPTKLINPEYWAIKQIIGGG